MVTKKKKKVFSDINITPLTDIFLVLLIIMMVVAPSFRTDNADIAVPQIKNGQSLKDKKAEVSLTKDGRFFLNGNEIAADDLSAALSELKPGLETAQVIVKADKSAKSSEIMYVMRAAKDAEYEKLTVAGEPLSTAEQKDLETRSVDVTTEVNPDAPFAQRPQTAPDSGWEE